MPFSRHFFHCSLIRQSIKDMFWSCACGMPHHHVVKLEVVILVAKVKVFFNLFKAYYYNFKNNIISIQKHPLVVILIIVAKP